MTPSQARRSPAAVSRHGSTHGDRPDFHLRSTSASRRPSTDVNAAHVAYDRAFDVLASSAEALDRKHDQALTRALRKAQDRCAELSRERDEARALLAKTEQDHARLSMAASQ